MPMMSVGDMAQPFIQTRQGTAMKAEIQRLSNELVTGLADDPARHLAGDFGPLTGIDASLSRLAAYKSVTAEAGMFTEIMQSALGRVDELASDLGGALLSAATTTTPARISALGIEAVQKFETAISALNTRLGDRSLFSGVATAATPLPDGKALLDTLEGVVSGAASAEEVDTALTDWFAAVNGFEATYQGGGALAPVNLGEG
ncbi:MAG: flagellin, partial [Paracoccaceae bacterium]